MAGMRGSIAAKRVGAGTRGGVGRIGAMAVGLAVLLALVATGEARAGVYEVVQCGWGVGAELDPSVAATEGVGFSLDPAGCTAAPGSGPVGMGFEGGVAPDGARGLARARWIAPPGTSFTAAHVTWFGNPQAGNWQGLGVDVEARFHVLAESWTSTAPARLDLPIEGHAWAFEAWLQCLLSGPAVDCTRSVASTMRLRELVFALSDPVAPAAQLGGTLAAAGWHRGTATLELGAADSGSGVAAANATIDGVQVLGAVPACAVRMIEGEVRATKLQPCSPTVTQATEIDTTRLADGAHLLHGCAADFSGGQGCAPDHQIEIDNSPPTASFVGADEGQVAVTVKDRFSGPVAGTISLRRTDAEAWSDLPTAFDRDGSEAATLTAPLPDLSAGAYFLRAVAADAAGNSGSAQRRVAGSPAELRRQAADGHGSKGTAAHGGGPAPRRRATHLTVRLVASGDAGGAARPLLVNLADRGSPGSAGGSALTVDYGTAVAMRGRLTDARGAAVTGRLVTVGVRAAAGIGRGPERRTVITDRDGRFGLRLPPGTSRHLTVAFHGGGGFAPAARRSLTLRVRAGLSLIADPTELRTGESVHLHGRVRLGPAQVSGRGKLVAIQYLERATKRWRPALVVRTDAKGRFDTSYRFRYVTGVARIRLRATAPAEGGWPFARGSSAPVTVTVRSG
jgi:hypothetical protein